MTKSHTVRRRIIGIAAVSRRIDSWRWIEQVIISSYRFIIQLLDKDYTFWKYSEKTKSNLAKNPVFF